MINIIKASPPAGPRSSARMPPSRKPSEPPACRGALQSMKSMINSYRTYIYIYIYIHTTICAQKGPQGEVSEVPLVFVPVGAPWGTPPPIRNEMLLGPYKASKGTITKVTSAKGHFCA